MDRSPRESNLTRRTSDSMLVAIPIFALLLLVALGPAWAPAGLLLATIGLLIANGRPPSKNRTNLLVCSIFAVVGGGVFTAALLVNWLR